MTTTYSAANEDAPDFRAAKERYKRALATHGEDYRRHMADPDGTADWWDGRLMRLAQLERACTSTMLNANFMQERCRDGVPMCERGCGCLDHEWFEQACMYDRPSHDRRPFTAAYDMTRGLLRRGLKIHAAWDAVQKRKG